MKGWPLFSPEATRQINAGPPWREHPDYYRDDPPEDVEAEQEEEFLMSLPEAHGEARDG